MHTIQISDELWDAYGGSPQRMRDTLWATVLPQTREETRDADAIVFEKIIRLNWATKCSICRAELDEGGEAAYRILADDRRHIVCVEHQEELPASVAA